MSIKIPPCGELEIIAGVMGSGKTLHVVQRILEIIQIERRPVFTNTPLRFKTLRQYLRIKSGPAYANLIYQLTEDHFSAFIDRQHEYAKVREKHLNECRLTGQQFSNQAVERLFYAQHGPNIYSGPLANSIHPMSYVVIDEAHHWFPMQGGKEVDQHLQRYISMCRHHMHQVILISQAPMQIAKCARRLATRYTICRPKADDRIAWGLRWKHIGLRPLGITTFRGDDIKDGEPVRHAEMMTNKSVLTFLPSVKVIFRLYDSFTHVGSPRRMVRQLHETRREHGITELETELQQKRQHAKDTLPMRAARTTTRLTLLIVATTTAFVIGASLNRSQPMPATEAPEQLTLEWNPPDEKITATSQNSIKIGHTWLAPGDNYHGATVLNVYPDGLLLIAHDVVYSITKDGRNRLGTTAEILDRLRDLYNQSGTFQPDESPGRP